MLPEPMWLPTPTPKMTQEFREICRTNLKLELTELEAADAARRLLQIYYLLVFANRDLKLPKEDGIKPPAQTPTLTTPRRRKRRRTRLTQPAKSEALHLHENESLSNDSPVSTIWCNGPFTDA